MNKLKRSKVEEAVTKLNEIREIIEDVKLEEEECMDNLEEHFSETERYQIMEECVDTLSDALDSIDEAIDTLTGV